MKCNALVIDPAIQFRSTSHELHDSLYAVMNIYRESCMIRGISLQISECCQGVSADGYNPSLGE